MLSQCVLSKFSHSQHLLKVPSKSSRVPRYDKAFSQSQSPHRQSIKKPKSFVSKSSIQVYPESQSPPNQKRYLQKVLRKITPSSLKTPSKNNPSCWESQSPSNQKRFLQKVLSKITQSSLKKPSKNNPSCWENTRGHMITKKHSELSSYNSPLCPDTTSTVYIDHTSSHI